MSNPRAPLQEVRRLVVKVGSSLLTDNGRGLDTAFIDRLAAEIEAVRKTGCEVTLVTSGAVAAGVNSLGIPKPREIRMKQAAAAIGQSRLMHAYEAGFQPLGVRVAQLLVTHDDLANRRRFLNARNTLSALFELGVLPILNENDSVVVEEIKVGDNDNLSALVASLVDAELLVILSDISGLFNRDPRRDATAERIPVVDRIDADVFAAAGGEGSSVGTGGMVTKLEAARKAGAVGIPTVIADGREPGALGRILGGEDVGTLFRPAADRLASRKHWIAFTLKPAGRIRVDSGAAAAIRRGGKSLLPKGVVAAEGAFGRGDSVSVCDTDGVEFARGLTEYSADETRRILGRNSSDIDSVLGYKYTDVIIHRDDLVLLDRA